MTTVWLIIIGIFLFGFIVFAHEFGHFITAKLSKIKVNEFALGMGPKLFGFKKGETAYSLRLLPIGGFCAMEGEDEESSDESAFGNKPVWKRMIVVAAGSIMNLILGFLLVMVLSGQQELLGSNQIARFTEDSALEAAGAQVGDEFYSIDGYRVRSDRDLSFAMALADPHDVDIVLQRGDEKIDLPHVAFHTVTAEEGEEYLSMDFYVLGREVTFGTLVTHSFNETVSLVRMVWKSLAGLVTGQFGMNEIAGPVGTAQAVTQAASAGLEQGFWSAVSNIVMMMAIITVNLGIVNLLPIPALDGGRLLFLIVEAIFRKPIPPKYEGWVHAAGFILLIGFMVLVTFNDIYRLITGAGLGG